MYGNGRIFKRGSIWWVAYYRFGVEIRKSSYSHKKHRAKKMLKKRIKILKLVKDNT